MSQTTTAAAAATTTSLNALLSDEQHATFMRAAIDEARAGLAEGGIPIGSVLVRVERAANTPTDNSSTAAAARTRTAEPSCTIIGRGHNRRVQRASPTLHAEIDCLERAGRQRRYDDCVLYSTLMPCFLCGGAVVQFGIRNVVVGESRSFAPHSRAMMEREARVDVRDLELDECVQLMAEFIERCPHLWNEDIGVADDAPSDDAANAAAANTTATSST